MATNNVPNGPVLGETWTDDNGDEWIFNGEGWEPIACAAVPTLFSSPSTMAFVQDEAITPYDASTHFRGIINDYSLGGTWPAGLSIDSAGLLTGTPTNTGSFTALTIGAVYLQQGGGTLLTAEFTAGVTSVSLDAPTLAVPLLNSLVATTGADPTLTRVGTGTVLDTYGNTITVAENVGRFQGARYAINLLASADQQANTGWAVIGTDITKQTSTTFRYAIGASTASRVHATISGDYSDSEMRGRIELRAVDAAGAGEELTISIQGDGTDYAVLGRQYVTLSEAWQSFSMLIADSTGRVWTGGARFCLEGPNPAATVQYDVEFRNAQLEDMTGRSNQNPSEFVSGTSAFSTANSNTVGANGVINAATPGTALSTLDGVLVTTDEVLGTWPTSLVNDFVVCITVVIPPDSLTFQNIFGYRSQPSASYITLTKVESDVGANANKLRVSKDTGTWYGIYSDSAPTVGSSVSVKIRFGSATAANPGTTLWLDDVVQADVEVSASGDLTIAAGQELHFGADQGGNLNLNEALKYFEVHEGEFTNAEVVAIVPGSGDSIPAASYTYLEDYDTFGPPADDTDIPSAVRAYLNGLDHPKTFSVEEQGYMADYTGYRKYNSVSAQATGINHLDAIHTLIPNELQFRKMYTPGHCMERQLQRNYPTKACVFGHAVPFSGTTPASGDVVDNTNYVVQTPPVDINDVEAENGYGIATTTCSLGGGIHAGHWVYARGTTLTSAVSDVATVIPVAELKYFYIGISIMICDAVGDFTNAEHCMVTGRGAASGPGNLTVKQRGYMSDRTAHVNGSYVASHMTEQAGISGLHWYWNMTTKCPLDANGNRYIDYAAEFHNTYWNRKWDNSATYSGLAVEGMVYDVDRDYMPTFIKSDAVGACQLYSDANNDGVADHGVDQTTGENWQKKGWEDFYDLIRNAPTYGRSDWMQTGGTDAATGTIAEGLNGVQLESMFTGFGTTYAYGNLSGQFANFCFWEKRSAEQPSCTHILFKQSSAVYDTKNWSSGRKNGPVRMGISAMCMENGFYQHQNQSGSDPVDADVWYDEYSVIRDALHAPYVYGDCPVKTEYVNCQDGANWLGAPLTNWYRHYGTEFDAANDMYGGSQLFEASVAGWVGTDGIVPTLNTTVGVPLDGTGCMEIPPPAVFGYWTSSVSVTGPAVTGALVSYAEYTVTLSLKADVPASDYRRVRVDFGGSSNNVMVGREWKRYVLVFKASNTANTSVALAIGGYLSRIWVDGVRVFAGNADRISRDFTNGHVCMNLSKDPYTFTLPADDYQRINGTQDPTVNNGQPCTGGLVTVPAYDGLLLVRKE